jgi:hypothetical protein
MGITLHERSAAGYSFHPMGQSDNLITNGGFELPLVDDLSRRFEASDSSIPGWQIVSGAVQIVNHTRLFPHEGFQCLLLECEDGRLSSIAQTFDGPAGVSITFELAASRASRAVLEVVLNGRGQILPSDQLWKPDETAFTHDMKWRHVHLCLIGQTSGQHRLEIGVKEFEPLDDRQADPRHRLQGLLLDALSIKPVGAT